MRIAVADDEKELLSQVTAIIRNAGHEVLCFANGIDLQNGLKRETFDVVLLDWNMPGKTGMEVIQWATEHLDTAPPFIMLTSRSNAQDVVRCLEAGATDYIVKPEADEVILARILAAVRRFLPATRLDEICLGGFVLNRKTQQLLKDGEEIAMTAKEFGLVDLLFQNIGKPLSRAYIFSRVWGGVADIETRTLDMHISRLRTKLQLSSETGLTIRTVFGFGYRMDEVHSGNS